ncbi:MAG: choice-of-anchor B family protein [Planctomycetes bacterium]|nr:choice-of-anchor B family protein [Planctomycetota bacterium]
MIRNVFLGAFLLAPLAAQTANCVLLSHQDLHAGYANIWGYVNPANNKEYALVGCTDGTSIVDVTIPTAPVERGFIPGPNSSWRELNTYSTYCYVSTEAGGTGIQVIDLTNPDAPFLAGTFGQAQFNNCHTITCDTQTGRIYCNGTNAGTVVYDASVNRVNPTFVGLATGSGNSNYFHDFHARNGFGYGSMIYNGQLRIIDLSTFPPTTLSNTTTPSAFTHNAWTNASSTLIATTDERAGAVVKFYDISNRNAPIARGQYTTNPASIPHNAYIIGNLCHVSWYTEGYILLDITDPNNPIEIASYDTWPGASGGFNGAWGVYPFLPSGNILISDISTGLYVVRPQITDLAVSHTPLPANTNDETGPYTVVATASSSNSLGAVELKWRLGGAGAYTTVAMTPTGNPNEFSANIPGQNAPATVQYHVEATDSVGTRSSPATGDDQFTVGVFTQVWFDDLEVERGWTTGLISGTQNDWQRGAPAGRTGTGWSDPSGAFGGSFAWGTDLGNTIGGTSFNGAYYANENVFLQSPSVPTNGVQGLRLRFRRWLSVNSADTARLLVNGTLIYSNAGVSQADTAWQWVDYDVSGILNAASTAVVRFEMTTNGTTNWGGWNIDNVELYNFSDCLPPTFYGAGTAGTGGNVPTINLSGAPRVGGAPFQVTSANLLGGAGTLLAIGFGQTSLPTFGITVLVDPASSSYLFTVASGTPGAAGAGGASWPFSVPANPALDNLYLFTQAAAFDSGSVGGTFSATDGMRFRLCAN